MKGASRIPFHESRSKEIGHKSLSSSRAGPTHATFGRWAGFFVVGALVVALIAGVMGSTPMQAQASGRMQATSSDLGKWVIIGTNNKGVFVTSDITASSPVWAPLNAGGALQVNEIALDPFDPKNVAYAATEVGLYKNTNWQGGGSWSLIFSRSQAESIFSLDAGSARFRDVKTTITTPDLVYVVVRGYKGTIHSYIARSEDGGNTWIKGAELLSPRSRYNAWGDYYGKATSSYPQMSNILPSSHDPNTLFIAFSAAYPDGYSFLAKSTNRGASYTEIRGGDGRNAPNMVHVPYADNQNDQVMYLDGLNSNARLEKSTDGGTTWTNITPPGRRSSLRVSRQNVEVDASNPDLIFYLNAPSGDPENGWPSLSVSSDGGASWTTGGSMRSQKYVVSGIVSFPNQSNQVMAPLGDGYWAGYSGVRRMVVLSQDGGATWQDKTGNLWNLWGDSGATTLRLVTAAQHDGTLTPAAIFRVDKVTVVDGDGNELPWDTLVYDRLTVEAEGSGLNPPNTITVKVTALKSGKITFLTLNKVETLPDGTTVYRRWVAAGNLVNQSNELTVAAVVFEQSDFDYQVVQTFMDNLGVPEERRMGTAWGFGDQERQLAPANLDYFKAAGYEIARAEVVGYAVPPDQFLGENQAKVLLYLGHGSHLENYLYLQGEDLGRPRLIGSRWTQGLQTVILFGCSVLDINDMNGWWGDVTSPGKRWVEIPGPQTWLGFQHKAPTTGTEEHGELAIEVITATFDGETIVSGQTYDALFLAPGPHELMVSARDQAGWQTVQTRTIVVEATIEGLTWAKHRFYDSGAIYGPGTQGILSSLDAKLEAAQQARDRGESQAAVNTLNAFIKEIRAQTGKHITPEAAEILIRGAQYAIEQLPQ